jgi:hypothetical protein
VAAEPNEHEGGDELEAWWQPPSPAVSSLQWLAPIRGMFPPVDRQVYEVPATVIELEPGLVWRGATEDDSELVAKYSNFYRDYISKDETEAMVSAHTLLSGEFQLKANASDPGPKVLCFLLAAAMHTSARLRTRVMRFETREQESLPHSGGPLLATTALPMRPLAEAVSDKDRSVIAETYQRVTRVMLDEGLDRHPLRRAIGSFRASVMSSFAEVSAVLVCTALESVFCSSKRTVVLKRLLGRYQTAIPDAATLEDQIDRLFRLRVAYVHALDYPPDLREPQQRVEALDSGLAAGKRLLTVALHDEELFLTGMQGRRALIALLDSASPPS